MAETSQRARREAHAENVRLNKPGRVGSFAEAERDRKTDEAQEKKSKKITVTVGEKGPVKIPGAIIIIVFGLLLLWLATTGQLKRIGKVWDYLQGKGEKITSAIPATATATLAQVPTIMDTPTYHVGNMLADSDAPGGMF